MPLRISQKVNTQEQISRKIKDLHTEYRVMVKDKGSLQIERHKVFLDGLYTI